MVCRLHNRPRLQDALALANQTPDEVPAELESDFDVDVWWFLVWSEQYRFGGGAFGLTETPFKVKNTNVQGLIDVGILESDAGKVRLLGPADLPEDGDPEQDKRFMVWTVTHHMVWVLEGGESAVAELMVKIDSKKTIVSLKVFGPHGGVNTRT